MNAVTILVVLACIGFSSAYLERCTTGADCAEGQCCLFGKLCAPKLPRYSTCYLTGKHGCGCVEGTSCQVTFSHTLFGKTFTLRQCMNDKVGEEKNVRRSIIRTCSVDSVAADCGPGRCCLGGKYCAPLIPKYVPCNLEDSHKCPCAKGLECRVTKSLTIPAILGITDSITLSLRQCMPKDESVVIEEVEMTEE
ncbi:uncharacterized protein LOC114527227 [Dendronephthya gigantea]|uniref:uncharacterized protein LOC114527227 n=1 Tax=Dendronephthya gigantea TaxID=151771 RepID=UPI001069B0C7|nr:uncharacterized protein LOC114527227 [Dendronephthya gigantea]